MRDFNHPDACYVECIMGKFLIQWDFIASFYYLKGTHKKDGEWLFTQTAIGQVGRVLTKREEGLDRMLRGDSCSEDDDALEQPAQRSCDIPSLMVFTIWLDGILDNMI